MIRRQRMWTWAAFVVIAVVIGLGIGWGWQALAATSEHSRTNATEATTSRSTSPAPAEAGGDHLGWRAWHSITGGECLSSFVDPWQAQYLVVSCETLHQAQVLDAQKLTSDTDYPGFDALVELTAEKCHGLGLIDRDAYPALGQLTIARTFPQNASEWDAHPTYLCIAAAPANTFFDRSVLAAAP